VDDGVRRAAFAAGAGAPYALNDARAASIARDKAFCAVVLREAGLPVLAGEMFFVTERWSDMRGGGREPQDALNYAAQASYPLFCKPISGSNGLYAEVIADAEGFRDYMGRVAREHFAILIQPYVRAPEYRAFVLDGAVLFSYLKHLPHVIGDGRNTLRDLIATLPRDNLAPSPNIRAHDGNGDYIGLDRVLKKGARATLEGPANRAAGGGAGALRDGAPAAMSALAAGAAAAIGLRLAAIDMFDLGAEGLIVIEVNSNPMIATLEEAERWDLIDTIWGANIAAALK
jgi:cyanophycin synthetase